MLINRRKAGYSEALKQTLTCLLVTFIFSFFGQSTWSVEAGEHGIKKFANNVYEYKYAYTNILVSRGPRVHHRECVCKLHSVKSIKITIVIRQQFPVKVWTDGRILLEFILDENKIRNFSQKISA